MKRLKVYSTPTCPYCIKVKEFLNENNIGYEDIDVSTDRQAAMDMVKKSGQMGVPVIESCNDIIIGFDPARIIGSVQDC